VAPCRRIREALLVDDTAPHVAEMMRERLRRMTPGERVAEGARLPPSRSGSPPSSRLEGLDIAYMVVGSVAALAHARARTTQDVDIVIDADERQLRALCAALPEERFYASVEAALDAHRRETRFNVIDVETGWKIDLIPLKRRAFSQREFQRRLPLTLLGMQVFVATVEDTIVAKLEWSTLAGASARQLEDARELVRVAGDSLDRTYVEACVAELGIEAAWRAL
jgi:hypothetical protein